MKKAGNAVPELLLQTDGLEFAAVESVLQFEHRIQNVFLYHKGFGTLKGCTQKGTDVTEFYHLGYSLFLFQVLLIAEFHGCLLFLIGRK